jgi:hypothetical protein
VLLWVDSALPCEEVKHPAGGQGAEYLWRPSSAISCRSEVEIPFAGLRGMESLAELRRSVAPAFAKASARSPFASSPRHAAEHPCEGECPFKELLNLEIQ